MSAACYGCLLSRIRMVSRQSGGDSEETTQLQGTPRNTVDSNPNMAEVNSTAKSKRYDRQLRIWGQEGQARLECCKLCLLNCGPTGSETLKNLVLGGIAGFTIVDDHKVCAQDLGNNFMVSPDSLGEPRAKVVTELIQGLNDMVAGSYAEESPESMIERNPQFFAQFTVVVATQMRERDVLKLEAICREHRVTLLVVRSYGLCGLLRPSIPEHVIVESKPDNIVDDLRVMEPFPELQQFADSINLDELDDVTLHHLPYVVLLIKGSQAWKASHDGRLPSSSKERSAFKDALSDMKRKAGEVPIDSENFAEATKAAFHAWTKYSIGSEAQAVLHDESASEDNLSSSSLDFWIIVAALKRFLAQEGGGVYLPLDGSIPDMHATTELYLRVQRIYREKAERDMAAVAAHVAAILTRLGRDKHSISRETLRQYCRNARNLRVVRYRPLAQEHSASGGTRGEVLTAALASEGTAAAASLYVLIRAVDRFHAMHGRFPGTAMDVSLEEDLPALKTCAQQLVGEIGANSAQISDDYVLEMVRFGAAELHAVAAFMGGMAAQEIIKLVTGQFTPVSGTLIYNGIACATASLEL